ncbi:MAG: inorganic phosphate transporter [Alphaproteobacteria bacterium]|nr:inorganic phosphate transporter [Alphaproteobacteria bacterium]
MTLAYLFFLSSGLFLGWSLGANDASNIFGAAVGSKMLKFKTAAWIASIFIILGAVFGGSATTKTLTALGNVNTLAGAFMVALSAGLSVYFMTKAGLTTSTSQAIVGAIIAWNLYAGYKTDMTVLVKIMSGWVLCPILAGLTAVGLYFLFKKLFTAWKIHILMQDQMLRIGFVIAGAFCTYALGANNIANVMGVFVLTAPFQTADFGYFTLNPAQILFFMGALAIAVGIFTYSHKVMATVGQSVMKMSPFIAFIIVLSEALVLFVFSSSALSNALTSVGLPAIPLVPVSSTQAVIGAILGIGLLKGGRSVNWSIIGRIVAGWITTPLTALVMCFISLFFLENVFQLVVVMH